MWFFQTGDAFFVAFVVMLVISIGACVPYGVYDHPLEYTMLGGDFSLTNRFASISNPADFDALNWPAGLLAGSMWSATVNERDFILLGGTYGRVRTSNPDPDAFYYNTLWKYDLSLDRWAYGGGYADLAGQPISENECQVSTPFGYDPGNWPGGSASPVIHRLNCTHAIYFSSSSVLPGGSWGQGGDVWFYDAGLSQWMLAFGYPVVAHYKNNYTGCPGPSCFRMSAQSSSVWYFEEGSSNATKSRVYVFGGIEAGNYSNSVWSFDVVSWQYDYVRGPRVGNHPGNYVSMGTENSTAMPGSRWSQYSWIGPFPRVYMYGGMGFSPSVPKGDRALNDLWRFDLLSRNWAWISGAADTETPNYHSSSNYDSANSPGSRLEGGVLAMGR